MSSKRKPIVFCTIKYLVATIIFFYFCNYSAIAQFNLVPNPSFEDTVPHGGFCKGPIENARHWFNPTLNTPDLYCYNSTSINCTVSSMNNGNGYQLARTGTAYAAIYTWYGKEYIAVRLDSSLSAKCTYYIEFYISNAEGYAMATDKMGCAFTSDTSQLDTTINYLPLLPAIESPAGVLLSDDQNWIPISGYYTANGSEQFMIIGNFNDINNLIFDTVRTSNFQAAYYYIDDVTILSCDSTALLLSSKDIINSQLISIFPNPTMDELNINYTGRKQMQKIELIDCFGRSVIQSQLSNNSDVITGFSKYINGIYILKISYTDATSELSRIQIIN